jgi:heat shock protein HtpX
MKVRQVFRSSIDPAALARQQVLNRLQSALLLCGLAGLAGLAGYSLAGFQGVLFGAITSGAILLFGSISGDSAFRHLHGAVPLTLRDAPALIRLVRELTGRAALRAEPQVYVLPSPVLQAMAAGTVQEPSLAMTTGLIQALPPRELAAVLAHEVAHIRHGDLFIMRLAQTAGSMTSAMANAGIIMLFVFLPLFWSTDIVISPLMIALLLVAPIISDLLQRSLSRRREFLADAGAAELTGDPVGLIRALERIQMLQGDDWERFASRGGRWLHWFRTHPPLQERIERLARMTQLRPFAVIDHDAVQSFLAPRGSRPQQLMRRLLM